MTSIVTFYKNGRKVKKTYKKYAPQLTISYHKLIEMGYRVIKVEKIG